MQQSLGRKPQEKGRAGTSPSVGAAQDFLSHIKTCIGLTGLFSLLLNPGFRSLRALHPGLCRAALSALGFALSTLS
jgi:hypothetical protein